jgi:hypothetical protein
MWLPHPKSPVFIWMEEEEEEEEDQRDILGKNDL